MFSDVRSENAALFERLMEIHSIHQNYTGFIHAASIKGGNSLHPTKLLLTHPRTGFIFRRIKSLFHHSNWQHIFLISFNGTSKTGVMHYK